MKGDSYARSRPARPPESRSVQEASERARSSAFAPAIADALRSTASYCTRASTQQRDIRASTRTTFTLADAQLVIAREHGIDSWTKFAERIDAILGRALADERCGQRVEHAVLAGDAAALEQLIREHGPMLLQTANMSWVGDLRRDGLGNRRAGRLAADDARAIIAAKQHFDSVGSSSPRSRETRARPAVVRRALRSGRRCHRQRRPQYARAPAASTSRGHHGQIVAHASLDAAHLRRFERRRRIPATDSEERGPHRRECCSTPAPTSTPSATCIAGRRRWDSWPRVSTRCRPACRRR